jgi:hypothetical protein
LQAPVRGQASGALILPCPSIIASVEREPRTTAGVMSSGTRRSSTSARSLPCGWLPEKALSAWPRSVGERPGPKSPGL